MEQQGKWIEAGQGWEGIESTLQLSGWDHKRRVIVLRRKQTYREKWKSIKNKLPLLEWCGYTTADFKRCQLLARMVGLVYNWWSLFVRLADPHQHREAITSRPMLLHSVARQTQHSGQTKLMVSNSHGQAEKIREMLTNLSQFLTQLIKDAEQLTQPERWRRILSKVFEKFLGGRLLKPLSWTLESG